MYNIPLFFYQNSSESLMNSFDLMDLIIRAIIDFTTIFILARVIYFPRTRNTDFLFTLILFNIVNFLICILLSGANLEVGFAFGLFAIFSIMRYRTITLPVKEMGFLFIAVAMGLLNSLATPTDNYLVLISANLFILILVYILDKTIVSGKNNSKEILYDRIDLILPDKKEELLEDLRERTGLDVQDVKIERIDFIKDVAEINIRYLKVLKMKKYLKILLLFTGFSFGLSQMQAQTFDDWEARPSLSLKYKLDNRFGFKGTYYHYLENDISAYEKSVVGLKIDYKVNSFIRPRLDIRYGFGEKRTYFDLRYSVRFRQKLGERFQLAYTPKLQHVMKEGKSPDYYLRNVLELSYKVSKPLSLFVFTENYQEIDAGLQFDQQKSGLGFQYKINKRNDFELAFEVKNKSNHKDLARITFNYTYTIR